MNRGQLRLALRRGLGELNPATSLWSDAELNDLLNEAVQALSAEAECFMRTIKRNTVGGQQEYQLPNDVNKIQDVKFYQGALYEEDVTNFWDVQQATNVNGVPFKYYIKRGVTEMSPQVSGGDIQLQPLSLPSGNVPTTVIGLYPVPGGSGPLTVVYYARHPQLVNDMQEPLIPIEFHRALVEYAKVFCMEDQGALQEADRALKKYSDFKERLKEINSFNMVAKGGLKMSYRHTSPHGEMLGSSWVYVGDAT